MINLPVPADRPMSFDDIIPWINRLNSGNVAIKENVALRELVLKMRVRNINGVVLKLKPITNNDYKNRFLSR